MNTSSVPETIEDILLGHTIIIKEPWIRLLDDLTIEFYEKEVVINIPIENEIPGDPRKD